MQTLRLLGNTAAAIDKIKEGINARPASPTLYMYYAEILLESGNKNKQKSVESGLWKDAWFTKNR